MRNRRALTIGVALIALGALGACQNGDEDGPGATVGSSTGTGDDGRRAESGADAGSEERPAGRR
ncbi:hypothetical protein ACWDTR_15880 [Streptomyces sp. NPDC003470]